MDVIDEGDWLFATKNMYFGGQHSSFRIPLQLDHSADPIRRRVGNVY